MSYNINGSSIPVPENDNLYRRAFPKRFMNPDGSAPSRSFVLKEKDKGKLSVDVASLCTEYESITQRGTFPADKFWLFQISVLDVVNTNAFNSIVNNLEVYHDPLNAQVHGEYNPAHAFIWGLIEEDDVVPGILARKAHRVGFGAF